MGQCFLSMLCAMEWGVFLFFAGWVVIMSLFIFFFVPETKGLPTERVQLLFARHPLWKRLMGPAADEILTRHANRKANRKAVAMDQGKVEEMPDMIVATVEDDAEATPQP